jgi:DNA-binding NtrC family response regulator
MTQGLPEAASRSSARATPADSLPVRRAPAVLVLRYDPESASQVAGLLRESGYEVAVSGSFRELSEQLDSAPTAPLIVLAGGLSEPPAREFLWGLRTRDVRGPVLALVERLDRERADQLRRLGVDDALDKPFDPTELLLVVRQLLERDELQRRTRILGRSPAIQEMLTKVAQYAPVSSTVLIEGESGTGKELVARAIHALSPRAGHPFVAVNCAAITETLLESELFGHERGAFTGAVAQRKGRFEQADHGTLFLDEVGEMAAATQVKLLRVLEERELVRVGGSEVVHVDVRVIAATNKVLREAVERGEFRRDLYYRLNVLHVDVPPLRERREDIPLLVHRFVQDFAREQGREPVEVSEEAMAILQNYDWPGNVRELRNQVERMLVQTYGARVRPKDVPTHIYERANPARLLPVAPARDAPGDEGEFLYRYLFELRRDLAEIRSLLQDSAQRGTLLREIPLNAGDEAHDAVPPARVEEPSAGAAAPAESAAAIRQPSRDPVEQTRALPPGEISSLGFRVGMSLDELEKRAIELTLAQVKGNRRQAAGILGIGERTLYRKLKEYGLA